MIEQDFIQATKEWFNYVAQDHHKDKDCHWFLRKVKKYSYGEKPEAVYYEIEHNGYIGDDVYFHGHTADDCMLQATQYIRNYIKENPYISAY